MATLRGRDETECYKAQAEAKACAMCPERAFSVCTGRRYLKNWLGLMPNWRLNMLANALGLS